MRVRASRRKTDAARGTRRREVEGEGGRREQLVRGHVHLKDVEEVGVEHHEHPRPRDPLGLGVRLALGADVPESV